MGYTDQLHSGKLNKRVTEVEKNIDRMIKQIQLLEKIVLKNSDIWGRVPYGGSNIKNKIK